MKNKFLTPLAGALAMAFTLAAPAAHAVAELNPAAVKLVTNPDAKLEAGKEYMAAINYPNLLNVVDLSTNKVLKACALPGGFGPGVVQIAPDRKIAYMLNNRFGSIHGVELDSCKIVFNAEMSWKPNERAKSVFSIAVSRDGKEIYTVQNPTLLHRDRYETQQPRLAVYDTSAGLDAKPIRTYPAPRQTTMMQVADDGSLYVAGDNLYKVDVQTGKFEIAMPVREWGRENYSAPDLLYVWPTQNPTRDFMLLYTAAKFKDDKQDLATADWVYGMYSINLTTGEKELADFAELSELYFTGYRSPKDRNHIYGVLNGLRKYDIKEQKLIASADLEHSYYVLSGNEDGSRVYLTGTFNDVAVYDDNLNRLDTIKLVGGDQSLGTAQVFRR